ncbi:MAG: hypothetical protein ACKVP0_27175 [Pirellulaceae bacterium]
MTNDSITDEVRAIRRELAAQFDNDASKILADARQREATDGHTYVTLPKLPAAAAKADHVAQTPPSLPRSVK